MPQAAARDRDIRAAIRDALAATRCYDGVYLSGLPEDFGQSSGRLLVAVVEPGGARVESPWDAAPEEGLVVRGSAALTLIARHEDPEIRDQDAEWLVAIACNALNGQTLAGVTSPQFSMVESWRALPAQAPERRFQATFNYLYFVEGVNNFNTVE